MYTTGHQNKRQKHNNISWYILKRDKVQVDGNDGNKPNYIHEKWRGH
jgi:hypothetical protein